jgi:hypothetical protein
MLNIRLTNHLPRDTNTREGTRIGAITKIIAESDALAGKSTNIKPDISAVSEMSADNNVTQSQTGGNNRVLPNI